MLRLSLLVPVFFPFFTLLATGPVNAKEAKSYVEHCPGNTLQEISLSFWSAWTEYHALSQINQGDAPYRTHLVGSQDKTQTQHTFRQCLSKINKGNEPGIERDAMHWIVEHEAMRLSNPVLQLNFSTVYSWLDQYRVAVSSQPWQTEEGQLAYPKHVKALPLYIQSQTDTLRQAALNKQVQSCEATKRHLAAMKHHLTDDNFYFSVLAPFQAPEEENIQDVSAAVKSLEEYTDVLENVYLPACREQPSVYHWPEGENAYAEALRYYTSTALSADTIHQIGLSHVALLMSQVDMIRTQPDFMSKYPSHSASSLFDRLRDDPELGFDSAEAMLEQSAYWGEVIRNENRGGFTVPDDFPVLKTQPVPASIAAGSAEAMYQTGSDGLSGTMYINTSNPGKSRRYALPVVVLHEGFPGHHYQVFDKFRNEALSLVRKKYYFHALGEGWALYTESLTPELLPDVAADLPHPDLLQIGVLSYDLLRAVRLVVDTGLHAKGWSRNQAVRYIVEHTAVAEFEAKNAVERFISLPGQATSYKIGQIAIVDAQRSAKLDLGENFDAQRFNQAVLHRTSLPLTLFEVSIRDWVETERRRILAAKQ